MVVAATTCTMAVILPFPKTSLIIGILSVIFGSIKGSGPIVWSVVLSVVSTSVISVSVISVSVVSVSIIFSLSLELDLFLESDLSLQ